MDFRKFAIIGVLVLAAFMVAQLFFFFVLDNLALGTLFTGLLYGWGAALVFAILPHKSHERKSTPLQWLGPKPHL